MSTSFCLGYVSFSTTVGQFHQSSEGYGAVESSARSRGLEGLALAQLDELEPAGEPHSALTQKTDEWSIWGCDMLPGVMAGKRPARSSVA
jgi:hypothetical protein